MTKLRNVKKVVEIKRNLCQPWPTGPVPGRHPELRCNAMTDTRTSATSRTPPGLTSSEPGRPSHPVVDELIARSRHLGADARNTNYAGGNTSAKGVAIDPATGSPVELLWVKGSG